MQTLLTSLIPVNCLQLQPHSNACNISLFKKRQGALARANGHWAHAHARPHTHSLFCTARLVSGTAAQGCMLYDKTCDAPRLLQQQSSANSKTTVVASVTAV